jgi:transcriptional regulator with XRE-family HTH domain
MGYSLNMAPREAFGRRVRRLRDALTLTQPELARRASVSRGYLARVELGMQSPTLEVIERLARALHVKPGQLFEDEPIDERRPRKPKA